MEDIDPFALTVKVLFDCKRCRPMFMACVIKTTQWIMQIDEAAAIFAGPECGLARNPRIVILNEEPLYVRWQTFE